MQIATTSSTVTSNLPSAARAFTIEAGAHAFRVLSKQLYSDPIAACIRELCCNAIDSHAAAGKAHVPITVHLPNSLEPWFSVYDEGTGMSWHDTEVLFTTYFGSSKRETNSQIGGFGLGSKSPFAYTDTFTVDVRWNGEIRSYVAYIGEDGQPSIQALTQPVKTDAPNGLSVKFAVKASDFSAFGTRASEICRWFDVAPKGNITINDNGSVTVLTGDLYKIYSGTYKPSSSGTLFVVQGGVKYSVDEKQLNLGEHLAGMLRDRYIYDFVVFAPIGSVTPAPSREQLSYDKSTVDFIVGAVETAYLDLVKHNGAVYNKCKTYADACRAYTANIQTPLFRSTSHKFQGRTVGSNTNADINIDGVNFIRVTQYDLQYATPGAKRLRPLNNYHTQSFSYDSVVWIKLKEMPRAFWKRLRHYNSLESTGQVKYFYIVYGDTSSPEFKKFEKTIGGIDWVTLDDMPEVPKAPRSTTVRPKSIVMPYTFRVNAKISSDEGWRSSLIKTEIDLNAGGVYSKLDGWNQIDSFDNITLARTAGFVDVSKLVVVPKSLWSKFDSAANWTHIDDHVNAALSSTGVKKVLKRRVSDIQAQGIVDSNALEEWGNVLRLYTPSQRYADMVSYLTKGHAIAHLLELYRTIDRPVRDISAVEKTAAVCELLFSRGLIHEAPSKLVKNLDLTARLRALLDTYPLLELPTQIPYYNKLTDRQREAIIDTVIMKGSN